MFVTLAFSFFKEFFQLNSVAPESKMESAKTLGKQTKLAFLLQIMSTILEK